MAINFRTILLLVLALSAAGGAALFARNWMTAQQAAVQGQTSAAETPDAVPTIEVLVAAKDLPTGSFLRSEHLKWKVWPQDAVSADYIVRCKGTGKHFEGAVARSRVVAGEPITALRVVHPGERGFLAAVLEPGKRAVSAPVDATTGISGFIFPTDFVDVILTFRYAVNDSSNGEVILAITAKFALRYAVLAIDQRVENEDGTAKVSKTATLEATARQAEAIFLGLQLGSVSLSLRSLSAESGDGSVPDGAVASSEETDRSYTGDVEAYYMLDNSQVTDAPAGGLARSRSCAVARRSS